MKTLSKFCTDFKSVAEGVFTYISILPRQHLSSSPAGTTSGYLAYIFPLGRIKRVFLQGLGHIYWRKMFSNQMRLKNILIVPDQYSSFDIDAITEQIRVDHDDVQAFAQSEMIFSTYRDSLRDDLINFRDEVCALLEYNLNTHCGILETIRRIGGIIVIIVAKKLGITYDEPRPTGHGRRLRKISKILCDYSDYLTPLQSQAAWKVTKLGNEGGYINSLYERAVRVRDAIINLRVFMTTIAIVDNHTALTDLGRGSTQCLERHLVMCSGNTVLKGFAINSGSECGKIRITFWNERIEEAYDARPLLVEQHHTELDDSGGGNSVFLDRHGVMCPGNSVLKGFVINSNGEFGRIRITYWSQETIDVRPRIEEHHTDFDDSGGGSAIYLDRHKVMCPANSVLKGFLINNNSDEFGKIRITYYVQYPN